MSTRWYPIYQKGGPQLRVFLPNFWLKLIKPVHDQPPNVVQFSCSMEMTRHDIKNYLEKIYDVKVSDVRTRIMLGQTKKQQGRGNIIKEDDVKLAYITMPKGTVFEFPNIFPEEEEKKKKSDAEKSLEDTKKNYKKFLNRNSKRVNMPGWFTI
ncbi:large ribosomal subunit protein uL23m isoform X2 [Onthophagus taurus]|uniref:large ribosomal subunit protein uL23m isoform X2 n=1 Tax=Onthophagus taurus TaxID=166361 RepID=UPI000C1FF38E|nr:probable 39S ribosomal protein L23, mitochondrial [Onthophagus taurus]XP_022910418.1 probable 39S ribosomal protein L23, mitochondrial [Onthophagus taurus]